MKLTTDQIVNRVLAGDSNPAWRAGAAPKPEPRPAASDAEIERIKRSVEAQLDEYEVAIRSASDWWQGWRNRRRGFRAKRRQQVAAE